MNKSANMFKKALKQMKCNQDNNNYFIDFMEDNNLVDGDEIKILNTLLEGLIVTVTVNGVANCDIEYEIDSRLLRGTLDFVKIEDE
jgi:hypothetical protein